MSAPLLATKFYFPLGRQNLVSRPRLLERLQQGVHCPLTLVSAPAGYGKTTLMSEWHAGAGHSIPTAWLSLDTDDNDLARFLTYLIEALEVVRQATRIAPFNWSSRMAARSSCAARWSRFSSG